MSKSSSKSERKGLQEGSETSNVVLFRDIGTDKTLESKMEVEELKMLRATVRVTRVYRIRNEHIRRTAQVNHFRDKIREARF